MKNDLEICVQKEFYVLDSDLTKLIYDEQYKLKNNIDKEIKTSIKIINEPVEEMARSARQLLEGSIKNVGS